MKNRIFRPPLKFGLSDYDLDKMACYGTEPIDADKDVVNPAYRKMKQAIKKLKEKVGRLEAKFYPLLEQAIDTPLEHMPALTKKQIDLREKISDHQGQIEKLETQASAVPQKIKLKDMPEDIRYNKLTTESKMLMNIIKMICYCAEAAVANLAAPYLMREKEEKLKFVQQVINSPVDMAVDHQEKTLSITVYSLSAPRYNTALKELINLLNDTQTTFPGTDLCLVYKMHP